MFLCGQIERLWVVEVVVVAPSVITTPAKPEKHSALHPFKQKDRTQVRSEVVTPGKKLPNNFFTVVSSAGDYKRGGVGVKWGAQ